MKTKKCSHETSRADYGCAEGGTIEIARWCLACGALLKLAVANDNHPAVAVEIAAALLAENVAGQPRGPEFDPEARGWDDRCEDVIDDHEHTPGEAIGWLAHAIVNHDDERTEASATVAGPRGRTVIELILSGLLLLLCGFVTGVMFGRRNAYRHAARSMWPTTTGADAHTTLPAARLPAASRRALYRQQRANRADLRRALHR